MLLRVSSLLTAILIAPAVVSAQDTTRTRVLDTITVTAERRPVATAATPATVRVVTAAQWRARGVSDLSTLLRDIPGLQLDPVVGSGAGISIQGLGSDRVEILLDGAPVAGRLNNQFDLTRLDLAQFERIEIVEGPQSTLYGSTALGGVINLITRTPNGRHADFTTQGGSYGQLDFSGRVSTLAGVTGLSLTGGHRHIDLAPGHSIGIGGSADRWSVGANMLTPVGSALLDIRASHTREDQQYPASFGPGFDFANDARNRQTDVLASLRIGADATEIRAHASVYQHTIDETFIQQNATTTDPQSQRLADLEIIHRGTAGSGQWVAGLRGAHEWITTSRLASPTESANTGALYGSAEWQLNHELSLSTGARVTAAERWGTDFAPRLGLVWRGNSGTYAKLALAHGFRAPSFTEQFSNFTNVEAFYAVIGNPDLKAERSWNLSGEVGTRFHAGDVYLRGYGNQLRDFIEANYTGKQGQISQFTYQNVVKAHTVGGEVGVRYAVGIATLQGSYAYLDAKDETNDQPLLGRAKHTVRGALTLADRSWSFTGEAVRNSSLPISQDRRTNALIYQGASPRVNLRATVDLMRAWRLTGGVDNVGNVIPENAIAGFGRRWYAGITWAR